MNLADATHRASRLRQELLPFCYAVEIAGSIRRQKPEGIKDLELVVVPHWDMRPDPADLFGGEVNTNVLHADWANRPDCSVQWIKPGVAEAIPWQVQDTGKYWRGLLKDGTKLDLFLATETNFGLIYAIRTGPSDFSRLLVTDRARGGYKPGHLQVSDGQLWHGAVTIPAPTESAVFSALGVEWLEPWERGVKTPRLFAPMGGMRPAKATP